MAPPLDRLSKLDISTVNGVRKRLDASEESSRRQASKTTVVGVGRILVVEQAGFEQRGGVYP